MIHPLMHEDSIKQPIKQRLQEAKRFVDSVLDCARQSLIDAVVVFFEKQISPIALLAFEMALLGLITDLKETRKLESRRSMHKTLVKLTTPVRQMTALLNPGTSE